MNHNAALAEVKPTSDFHNLLAKLKRTGNRCYGRFTRVQVEELKLALVPNLLQICQRLFPSGVLSRTGDYWHVPVLAISINLQTGDFFALPFDLRVKRRLGDFISLYGLVYELPFRQAMAALSRMTKDVSEIPETFSSKENDREKKRIVAAATFGTNGALSSLAIRRRVLAYLAAHAECYPKAKEEHPEFFYAAAFTRLLRAWTKALPEEFFRIREVSDGKKNIAFLFSNLNQNENV
jgi:hypothetical protein